MTEEEEEAAHIEELRDAARKMGAEAKRRALEAGIDINRPQLGQRKTVRVDPSRWSRRQSYHVPADGPMPVAPELAAADVTLELTGEEEEAAMMQSMEGDPETVALELTGPEVWLVRLALQTFRDHRPYHYDRVDDETGVLDGVLSRMPPAPRWPGPAHRS